MRWLGANNSMEGIIFLVMAVVWAVVQILNRSTRKHRIPAPKQVPSRPTTTRPVPPAQRSPASDPKDELRRFLEELAGMEPETERDQDPTLPADHPPPLPPRAPGPSRFPAAPMRAPTTPPSFVSPQPMARRPTTPSPVAQQKKTRIHSGIETGIRIAPLPDVSENWVAPESFRPPSLSMPSLPTTHLGGGQGYSGISTSPRRGSHLIPTKDRSAFRRAVILAAILGAPRALAPVGRDLPYGD